MQPQRALQDTTAETEGFNGLTSLNGPTMIRTEYSRHDCTIKELKDATAECLAGHDCGDPIEES
jgi:hypothetical protein